MKTNQRGDAMALAVAVLALALVAALGFIFWQNFRQGKSDKSITDNQAVQTDEPSKVTEVSLPNEKLIFSIPESWKAEVETVADTEYDGPARDKASIKNADGAIVLNIESGISGIGGACEGEPETSLNAVSATKTKITRVVSGEDKDIRSSDIYAVQSYLHSPSYGYLPVVFLTDDISAKTVGVANKTCFPGYAALYQGKNVSSLVGVSTATIVSGDATDTFDFQKTKEQAVSMLENGDLHQAYEILKTAHY